MAILAQDVRELARALRRACAEHGWEHNSFAPSELHAFHGAPEPRMCGMIWRFHRELLIECVGVRVRYEGRRFAVDADPEPRARFAASQERVNDRARRGVCTGCGGPLPCPNAWLGSGPAPRGQHTPPLPGPTAAEVREGARQAIDQLNRESIGIARALGLESVSFGRDEEARP